MFRILICLLPLCTFGQTYIFDDFSKAELQSPPWLGDTSKFKVSGMRLQLDDSIANEASIYQSSSVMAPGRWDFHGELDFNPSSSNYLEFILMCDQSDPSTCFYGYSLKLGGNSKDQLQLVRKDTGNETVIWASSDDFLDDDPLRFHISARRSVDYTWSIYADTGNFNQWQLLGSVLDKTHRFSAYTGLKCHYTKTRSQHFYLDSLRISGAMELDSAGPALVSWRFVDSSQVILLFNEKLDETGALCYLNNDVNVLNHLWQSSRPKEILVALGSAIDANIIHNLYYKGLDDLFGNSSADSVPLLRRVAKAGDLVFNEVMADPLPKVDLDPTSFPALEWLEFYNASTLAINLEGFQLQVGTKFYSFDTALILPNEYFVVCALGSSTLWPQAIQVVEIDWPSTALKNEGSDLSLWSPEGQLIESISYSSDWYSIPAKAEGGWSLERVDQNSNCRNAHNWQASIASSGASPGSKNTNFGILEDTLRPEILETGLASAQELVLLFSKNLEASTLGEAWQIEPKLEIDSLRIFGKEWHFYFAEPLIKAQLYQLRFLDIIRDCAGNSLEQRVFNFGLADKPEIGEIKISEVLFNPLAEGVDFIEVHSFGTNILDMSDLRVATWDATTGLVNLPLILTDKSRLLLPGEYLALCLDRELLLESHSAKAAHVFEVEELPSLPDEGARLVLLNGALTVLDKVEVKEQWHHPYLSNTEGYSLMRLYFDNDALKSTHWQTTPNSAGRATPGWAVFEGVATSKDEWIAKPSYFSPDLNGFNDRLTLHYNLESAQSWAQVFIYDEHGNLRRHLLAGEPIPQSGTLLWQGLDDSGNLCESGIYIALLEYRQPTGLLKKARCTFVLSL